MPPPAEDRRPPGPRPGRRTEAGVSRSGRRDLWPLDFGRAKAILARERMDMETAGEPAWAFFDRLRTLRLRLPEVALDERATHRFCTRVPAPRIME